MTERPTTAQEPAGAPVPSPPSERVERPAEVVRLASTAREVLAELRQDDLGDGARRRASVLYERSLTELSGLLSGGLRTELTELVGRRPARPGGPEDHGAPAPSAGELRVADAQLAGWLDGLLSTMQASMAAEAFRTQRAQEDEARQAEEREERERRARDTSYL